MPPPENRPQHPSPAALQRRAHLPRPSSSVAAVALFVAWITLTLVVGTVVLAASVPPALTTIALAMATFVAISTLGLVAIWRGRAQPWGYRLGSGCLFLLTALPTARLSYLLANGRESDHTFVQGVLALIPALAGLYIWVPFTFGKLSRFFYQQRRSSKKRR